MNEHLEHAQAMRALSDRFWRLGFNIVPLGKDKRPVITRVFNGKPFRFVWKEWEETRQTEKLYRAVRSPAWWTDVSGVAGICGPVSDNAACIDFDPPKENPAAVVPRSIIDAFLAALSLPSDYAWVVASPRQGWHVWVRCPGLSIDKGKLDRPIAGLDDGFHAELRWQGHYAALPGSGHARGVYTWAHDEPVDAPAIVAPDALLAAYDAVTVIVQKSAPMTNGSVVYTNGHTPTNGAESWARTALEGELDRLRNSGSNRNDTLNRAVYSVAQIVAGGYLSESEVEQAFYELALAIGLDEAEIMPTIRSGMTSGMKQPRHPPDNGIDAYEVYAYGFAAECPDPLPEWDDAPAQLRKHITWPYAVIDGRIHFCWESKDGIDSKPVCDFTAAIVEEVEDEHEGSNLVIAGVGLRRGPFRLEMPGSDFGSDVRVLQALTAATGGVDVVYRDMHKHLRPAIGKLTEVDARPKRIRYRRTGWVDESFASFLMPGADPDALISLPREIVYSVPDAQASPQAALDGLQALIEAMDVQNTTPLLAGLLTGPVLRPAGWHNERAALFVAGRTGSLKTSWTQTAMCIYGSLHSRNDNLLKLGEGGTRNAIMAYAAYAHDLPLLIDNFKPNTGDGKGGLVSLIHNILEGSDRKRSTRDGSLKESKLIRCVPVLTGEDVPRDDPASLARMLLVEFQWQRGEPNEKLTFAQEHVEHLPVIGWEWIRWIAGDGREVVERIGKEFGRVRDRWARHLVKLQKESANIARVASNLAVNELTWTIATHHPLFGRLLSAYTEAHRDGLKRMAAIMSQSTLESMEALQYRAALRELLGGGWWLQERAQAGIVASEHLLDRRLGWRDSAGYYILPTTALNAVRRLMGPGAIQISVQMLHKQFVELGWIALSGADKTTRIISVGNEKHRVLHFKPSLFDDGDNEPAEDSDDDVDDNTLREMGL